MESGNIRALLIINYPLHTESDAAWIQLDGRHLTAVVSLSLIIESDVKIRS